MKTLLFLFALTLCLASCSNIAEFRAHPMYYSLYNYQYTSKETVEIIKVDSAFKIGDTIINDQTHYVLVSKVR